MRIRGKYYDFILRFIECVLMDLVIKGNGGGNLMEKLQSLLLVFYISCLLPFTFLMSSTDCGLVTDMGNLRINCLFMKY